MPDNREFYRKDGLEYARISSILGETMPVFHPSKHNGLAFWQQKEPDAALILERSQKRGTMIHGQIEKYLLGDQYQGEGQTVEELMLYNIPGYLNYLNPLLEEIKTQNEKDTSWPALAESPLLIEQELFCSHGYAGTPDMRCWFENKYTVWDWKTARSHLEEGVQKKLRPPSRYSEAKVQVSAYALAHNLELASAGDYPPIEQCAICVCYDWCEPSLFILSIEEIKKAAHEFVERFGFYKELKNSIFPRSIENDLSIV